ADFGAILERHQQRVEIGNGGKGERAQRYLGAGAACASIARLGFLCLGVSLLLEPLGLSCGLFGSGGIFRLGGLGGLSFGLAANTVLFLAGGALALLLFLLQFEQVSVQVALELLG